MQRISLYIYIEYCISLNVVKYIYIFSQHILCLQCSEIDASCCMSLIRIYILLQHGNHLTILTFEFHYFIYDLQISQTKQ